MSHNNVAVPASYLLLERDGKILLMRRFQTGYMDGSYGLPAGHVDEGELPVDTMVREAKEEINVDLLASDLEFVHVAYELPHDETGNRVDFYFRATNWSGEPVIVEPHKCDALLWVPLDELPENMIPKVRQALIAIWKGRMIG
jgi:mutator protein MutT